MRQTPIEYTRRVSRAREPLVQPSLSLSRTVRNIGIRKLIRQGLGRRIIEKISRRELVKASTYREYERRIEEYARRRQRPKHSVYQEHCECNQDVSPIDPADTRSRPLFWTDAEGCLQEFIKAFFFATLLLVNMRIE